MKKGTKRGIPFYGLTRLVHAYQITNVELGTIIGCSTRTAKRRLDDPKTFTLEELESLCRKSEIPWEEIKGALKLC